MKSLIRVVIFTMAGISVILLVGAVSFLFWLTSADEKKKVKPSMLEPVAQPCNAHWVYRS